MVKVDFGGTGKGGEWLTVNVDGQGIAHPAPDICADVTDANQLLFKHFEPSSIDEARCIATFEHLPAHLLDRTLKLWLALLKPGARLLIMVPDIQQIVVEWQGGGYSTKTAMDMIFSPPEWTQKLPGEVHRYGFDGELLVGMLRDAGYRDARVCDGPQGTFFVDGYAVPNLWVEAWK